MGCHASVVQFDVGCLVTAEDLAKSDAKVTLEVAHAVVVGAELFLEGRPGDESRLAGVDAMQALRQPSVNVEPHSRVRQRREIGFIEGYGVLLQALEILSGKA